MVIYSFVDIDGDGDLDVFELDFLEIFSITMKIWKSLIQ